MKTPDWVDEMLSSFEQKTEVHGEVQICECSFALRRPRECVTRTFITTGMSACPERVFPSRRLLLRSEFRSSRLRSGSDALPRLLATESAVLERRNLTASRSCSRFRPESLQNHGSFDPKRYTISSLPPQNPPSPAGLGSCGYRLWRCVRDGRPRSKSPTSVSKRRTSRKRNRF